MNNFYLIVVFIYYDYIYDRLMQICSKQN